MCWPQEVKCWKIVPSTCCDHYGADPAVPVPLYFGFAKLGLINNVFAVSLIYTAIYWPFAVMLLRTYFLAVPRELEEAAIVDGAIHWQVFTKIMLPHRLARHRHRRADHRALFVERVPDRHDLPAEGRQADRRGLVLPAQRPVQLGLG